MKKVLLSSVVALTLFAAAAPVLATGPDSFGDYNPQGGQTRTEQAAQVKNVRVHVADLVGAPVANVTVDFLVDGKASQAVTDANGDAVLSAKIGKTVAYRIAEVPAGYFQNSAQQGSVVVGSDMFTNVSLSLEKTSSYNVPGQQAQEGNNANTNTNPASRDEAKKSEAAAKNAGKAATKALPKTSAVK